MSSNNQYYADKPDKQCIQVPHKTHNHEDNMKLNRRQLRKLITETLLLKESEEKAGKELEDAAKNIAKNYK